MDNPKILIVDDEVHIRDSLNEHLSLRLECEIVEATNGYEAIERLENNNIDLILLDIKMPGISGMEVIQKAKEISRDIAIIVITKLDSSKFADEIKRLGADYIPKPFSLKIIRSEVEKKLKVIGKFSKK